jgi:hypothetical protein
MDIHRRLGVDDFFDVKDRSRGISVEAEGEDITGLFRIPSPGQRHNERGHLGSAAELTNEQEGTRPTTHMSHHFPR